ncbi:replicative DNA helicase [Polynucleobacter sphagniphilus]|jgi:replicative DNA helicase|uniref:Replicative DNA helicase n=1 Tax=Polynucleobacter sphagniphilus TaxID=1743169 RepID=A0AA43M803_9BURK|nr:replicative DNA helicase [Polynucleobacter sphagniphilus]MDH6154183.1 replicative DNA helicase [Polynucleobacter sphagniphilus]MDH6240457.1 replicative DNA helicase [Polynucleobacter sphagniphilus]MDH6248242.1 replicative DNA helicase [Polynucleobacter sphagniphilus]MDH6299835.1 replicative DNA helicase [Polynucleobacter sphagniphilus]MDH6503315.1 replicative DNA helicase [Polynucleobacter sphagniphilus]
MAESRSRSVASNPGMMGSGDPVVQALKVPPHSVEAEQSLLGGLLIDNTAWDRLGGILNEKDFYRPEHALIYKVIARLVGDNHPADVITVHEAVKSEQGGDLVGIDYLNSLAQSTPSAANIKGYADIVRDRSILRRLIEVSDNIVNSAFVPEGRSVRTLLDEAESRILQIGEEGSRKADYLEIEPLLRTVVARIDELYNRQGGSDITGIATGFIDLDKQTSGLQKGDLVIVAGRPSMGKTAFALNIAENVALAEGLPVVVFSMEMSGEQLAARLLGSVGRVDQGRMRTGKLQDDEWPRVTDAIARLSNTQILIDETGALSSLELRARARRIARNFGGTLGLVVIDYLQLMSGSGSENRATEISEISRSLKSLAKELQCPVVALSQLNRGLEQRPNKRPIMSDLRESGAIEQDADLIMFIYRDEVYHPDTTTDKGVAEIIIGKQRNGPIGTIRLSWQGPYTKFDNLAAGSIAYSSGGYEPF